MAEAIKNRYEFVIGTTKLVVRPTDRIVGKPRISRITQMLLYLCLIYGNLRPNGNFTSATTVSFRAGS